ncbi:MULTISPECIES: lysozyme inhibitor LprI family protein [unclassified Tatumella]|uniref:lysozyme inhibitor LprI family protein n=1 Tax=unclassified Tatumella TaxID=2649542 RepID=UPI001BAEFCAB|nr:MULTISPECIES: lysozyme inhibitor LprI family protein [unclassified Tatumella]MBS0878563.1 hypothetical protein [Tatumella sp. JGM82]MBS0892060.1 hypothetical protein [Tatumella sp. JGM94]MBS0900839.1 hypothetical protein [Tatumella sp. JGM100]
MLKLNHHLIPLALLFGYGFQSYADVPLPSSVLKGNSETFDISCPKNPQQTTIDIDNCMSSKLDAVKSVELKYVNAARNRISETQDQQTLQAFDEENKAWDSLIDAATHATDIKWGEGTIRSSEAIGREITLIELRIHNQWQNWLRYEDSSPPVLPEPLFHNENN